MQMLMQMSSVDDDAPPRSDEAVRARDAGEVRDAEHEVEGTASC